MVDEAHFNTTDYTDLTNTAAQGEYFGQNSALISGQTVFAVKVTAVLEKTDAGAASGKVGIKSSSTYAYGPTYNLSTSWALTSKVFETDPNTSSQWGYAAVNAAVVGFEVV